METNWQDWRVPRELKERGAMRGDAALFLPMLRKLRDGKPVTLLALGSSVVGAHAGCTAPWPLLRHCPCPLCCGSRCGRWGGDGWALRVLRQLNATWPHPQHKLYNLGEPGGDLMPSLLACPSSYLSFQPDLVLIDFFTAYHGGNDALIYERIIRMLLGSGSQTKPPGTSAAMPNQVPAVMFVNFFEFGDRHHARSTYTTMGSQLAETLQKDAASVVDLWHGTKPAQVLGSSSAHAQ